MTEKTTPQIRFCGVVHVTHVPDDLCLMMPPKIGSQLVRRETGRSPRHHAIVFSITAPYCSSFPSPFVSVRCAVRISTARRVLALPSHRYSTLLLSIPFRCQSQRVLSLSILIPATRFLSLSPLRISSPFHLIAYRNFSISQLRRSYPQCRICVCGPCG